MAVREPGQGTGGTEPQIKQVSDLEAVRRACGTEHVQQGCGTDVWTDVGTDVRDGRLSGGQSQRQMSCPRPGSTLGQR